MKCLILATYSDSQIWEKGKTKRHRQKADNMEKISKISFALIILIFLIGCESKNKQVSSDAKSKPAEELPKTNTEKPKKDSQTYRNSNTAVKESQSIEYKLATINAGGYISEDDLSVKRFRTLLSQLSQKYVEDKEQIADMSVTAQNMLRNDGISESLLNIMTGMNLLFNSKVSNQKYAEYASAYVTLRSTGQTHSEAVSGLKALLQSLGVY